MMPLCDESINIMASRGEAGRTGTPLTNPNYLIQESPLWLSDSQWSGDELAVHPTPSSVVICPAQIMFSISSKSLEHSSESNLIHVA